MVVGMGQHDGVREVGRRKPVGGKMVKSGLAVRRAQRKGTKREVPREGAREEGNGSTRVTGRAREKQMVRSE
jgi:hypothetical protein